MASDLSRLMSVLGDLGLRTNLPEPQRSNAAVQEGPLIVELDTDYRERGRFLLVDRLSGDDEDPVRLFRWRHIYPIEIDLPEDLDEIARALWILNRTADIGYSGLCEDTPALYWEYIQVIKGSDVLEGAALGEIVGLIDFVTQLHGALLDRIGRGELDCDEMRLELQQAGLVPDGLL